MKSPSVFNNVQCYQAQHRYDQPSLKMTGKHIFCIKMRNSYSLWIRRYAPNYQFVI